MKRSKDIVASRRDAIVKLLEDRGEASVAELAVQFDVSPLTIRRDLDYLADRQVLTRQYGTASLLNPLGRPSGSHQVRANIAIAREAAKHVDDGDCIFINTSSTALGIISFITAADVTVITNNGKALLLEANPNVSVLLTGGEIRPPRASMTGDITFESIKRITATKCFIGVTGFSADNGLTSATAPEPPVNALMMDRSHKHFIVADSSKLGLSSSFCFGRVDEVDVLITDTEARNSQVDKLYEAGVGKIIRVDPKLVAADTLPGRLSH